MGKLFKIDGEISKKAKLAIEILGLIFFIFVWWLTTFPFESPTIYFNASGGTQPYSYEWTGPDNYSKTITDNTKISGLAYGEYNVTITDSVGASFSSSIVLSKEKGDQTFNHEAETEEGLNLGIDAVLKNSFVDKGVFPSPSSVLASFQELHFQDYLVRNAYISIKLNIFGYFLAIVSSLLVGFLIGLVPFFRSLLSRYIEAIRFVPLAAVTGLFIAWFGMAMNMKVQFLAFGIFVFLVPVVVQRINEIERIYKQTAYTLGATSWQTIRYVYWPHVSSRIIDDVKVLTAISWTYIIVAELVNTSEGGLGALIFKAQRTSRLDKVFAILLIIILIGYLQDLLFSWLDKRLYPFKYQKKK